ncbi:MAG: ATP-dependent DNA helicase [Cyanobacteria bacterium]|nr:ATP-dependent DNA helicase [Cyanobacteriota bacterium]
MSLFNPSDFSEQSPAPSPASTMAGYFEILKMFPSYEPRPAQEVMVRNIGEAFEKKESLVIEAGTGSGKSFGYLIPALLQSVKPIVITTGTIALQEQLLHKDIPFLLKATQQEDLNVTLVKGRGNYLCVQKLLELEKELGLTAPERLHLSYLKSELQRGWDGDIGTSDFPIPKELWEEVKSDTEDCLGSRCQFFKENPYRQARENLEKADIIIANHALYLQDVTAGKSLLPPHEIVIVDEAHNFKHYALNAFTSRIGKYATTKILRKIHRRLQPVPEAFISYIGDSESTLLEWLFRFNKSSFRLYPDAQFFSTASQYVRILQELRQWIHQMDVKQLSIVESELDADRVTIQRNKLIGQLEGLLMSWEFMLLESPFEQERVNWVEVDQNRLYYELKSTPLNVSEILKTTLWPDKTAILTSATLSINKNLGYIKSDLGLDEAGEVILESPFSYDQQCVLYLPENLPDPNDLDYPMAIAEEIHRLLLLTQGRAFVLFTSVQNMRKVSDALIQVLPFPCRVQGDLPRNKIIEWFKQTPGSVLFATSTFWEGIDIPGENLSCVIMDKIPFHSPEDPVHQAMVDFIKKQGKDWFTHYALPQAIIKMKQGFGRLIRTKEDKGIVAILDPRMRTKGYGRVIQRSLPTVQVIKSFHQLKSKTTPEQKTTS